MGKKLITLGWRVGRYYDRLAYVVLRTLNAFPEYVKKEASDEPTHLYVRLEIHLIVKTNWTHSCL